MAIRLQRLRRWRNDLRAAADISAAWRDQFHSFRKTTDCLTASRYKGTVNEFALPVTSPLLHASRACRMDHSRLDASYPQATVRDWARPGRRSGDHVVDDGSDDRRSCWRGTGGLVARRSKPRSNIRKRARDEPDGPCRFRHRCRCLTERIGGLPFTFRPRLGIFRLQQHADLVANRSPAITGDWIWQ